MTLRTRLSGNYSGEEIEGTFRNQRHHLSSVTLLVRLVYLSKIGGCVLAVIFNLVQRQMERGETGDTLPRI
jgi:hypothetical protein